MNSINYVKIASYCYAAAFGASFLIGLFALFMSTGKSENRVWRSFALLSFVNSVYCITGVFHNSSIEIADLYFYNVWNDILGMLLGPAFLTFVYTFLRRKKYFHISLAWIAGIFWCAILFRYPEKIISKTANFTNLPVQYFHYTPLYLGFLATLFGMIIFTLSILYVRGRNLPEWNSIMRWIFPTCVLWGISGIWDAYLTNLFKIAVPTSWIGGLSVVVAFLYVVTSKSQKAFLVQEQHALVMKDLDQARKIQNNLITNFFPDFGTVQITGKILPMDKIGGDYYEVSLLDKNHMSVFISDVTGHGIASAFMTSLIKVFKEEIPKKDLYHPSKVLNHINQRLNEKLFDFLVTGVYGVLERKSRKFTYSSAGHPPILLFKKGSRGSMELPQRGRLMGAFPEINLRSETITLGRGDKMLLLTDGFHEAMNLNGELYGLDRIKSFFESPAFSKINDLISDIRKFTDGAEQSDDMAALLVLVNE